MSRIQRAIFGGLSAALIGFAVPASAAPGGLATAQPATSSQLTLIGRRGGGGGGGHHSGGGGGRYYGGGGHYRGGWGHGGHGHFRGGYYGFWGGGYYPYYDNYYYDDGYGYDTCYYSRRLRARVCPEY